MVYLNDTPFNNTVDPVSASKNTSSYGQRRFRKIIYRGILISSLLMVCYFFGKDIQWTQLTQDYNFDPRDVDLIQYFCKNERFKDNEEEEMLMKVAQKNLLNGNNNDYMAEHAKVSHLQPDYFPDDDIPIHVWNDLPVKAAYYMIVRNDKIYGAREVVRSMEDHMTNGTRYPWIFLSNQYFSAEFRQSIKSLASSPVFFGRIDPYVWDYPHFVNVPRVEYFMQENEFRGVHKGASLSYHQMLRYQSGFFFHHPLFRNVEYSWRVEPESDYSCQMDEDMFLYMKDNNKTLGFVLTMKEVPNTIPTLWQRVSEFMTIYPEHILPKNESIMNWILDDNNEYNHCHFWNNFQIVDLAFFRSEAYQRYFEYMDNTGNFFYERWGDAPIQTIAAALFLKRDQFHFFNQIGYSHSVATHCPYDKDLMKKCSCNINDNYDFHDQSCTKSLLQLISPDIIKGMKEYQQNMNKEE